MKQESRKLPRASKTAKKAETRAAINSPFSLTSDVSCTGSQMPRLLGLAQASKLYRNLDFKNSKNFSINGNEIAWGTIGNASTSEGVFFEVLNAAGVHQVPMVISIWDDSYGISRWAFKYKISNVRYNFS